LFGKIAVRAKVASEDEVEDALRVQDALKDFGIQKRIGEILLDQGRLTSVEVASVLNKQSRGRRLHQIGGFEVLSKIGRGAVGAVFKARQQSMDRVVALKVVHPHASEDVMNVERIKREARLTAKLSHPNIVQAIDWGDSDGYYYFAMEFVAGETLHRLIIREGRMAEERVIDVGIQICEALEYLAQFEIVHRDIKPGNIVIGEGGVAKLCDFGLARFGTESVLGEEGARIALGTPYYISPEQVEGRDDVDARSDIYSLGATLYRAVTGHVPFEGASRPIIMSKHLSQPLPSPRRSNPAVSKSLADILGRMMEKQRSKRYADAAELRADLEELRQGRRPLCAGVAPCRPISIDARGSEPTGSTLDPDGKLQDFWRLRSDLIRLIPSDEERIDYARRLGQTKDADADPTDAIRAAILLISERRLNDARQILTRHRDAVTRHRDADDELGEIVAKLEALLAPRGMVYVPAGTFIMGLPEEDGERAADIESFYIDENPVTNAQYMRFVEAADHDPPSNWQDNRPPSAERDHPVTNVSWYDAKAYAEWHGRDLPTETQWEKAARGLEGRIWPWGNFFSADRCNCAEAGVGKTSAVGKFLGGVSPFGCYDMAGNVAEWLLDAYRGDEPAHDMRVIRGGSYADDSQGVRCAARTSLPTPASCPNVGFRCVASIDHDSPPRK